MKNRKRVLVVDDEPGVLGFVEISLSQAGYEVITTTSGEEALQLAKSEKPDIVLLDVLMVPMSGMHVLVELRTFSQVPVILFTALSFAVEEATKLGANGFIAKPFNPKEMLKKIEDLLNRETEE